MAGFYVAGVLSVENLSLAPLGAVLLAQHMRTRSWPSTCGIAAHPAACLAMALVVPASARAQTAEITPFVGYRVGGGFFSVPGGRVVDDEAAPSVGLVVNVAAGDATPDVKLEGLFSREQVRAEIRPDSRFDPRTSVALEVDQLQIGLRLDARTYVTFVDVSGVAGHHLMMRAPTRNIRKFVYLDCTMTNWRDETES